jgi:hypothetical protein
MSKVLLNEANYATCGVHAYKLGRSCEEMLVPDARRGLTHFAE